MQRLDCRKTLWVWCHGRSDVQQSDSDGNPNVFNVKHNDDGDRWLNANYANPNDTWNLDNRIVFRLRNSLISLPIFWESFVFQSDRSNLQAFFLFLQFGLKWQYISCCLQILLPKEP